MNNSRGWRAAALITSLLLLLGQAALAATVAITRGPYLQTGAPTSITVKWRTDAQTDSCVRYGTSLSSLTSQTCETTLTTEHAVELSSLLHNTKYFYSIGTSEGAIAGGDSTYFFFTSPRTGKVKPTRIWVIGDSGTGKRKARAVRDTYLPFTRTRHTDLWLMLGDNAYPNGTDSEYQKAVFNLYPMLLRNTVLWSTFGNHDAHTAHSASQSGPYYDIFALPKNGEAGGIASGTEAYYSFDYSNIHFVCLDSVESNRSPSGAMPTWLRTDLAATKQDWRIAFWHYPPYSKGSHDSDVDTPLGQMRQYAGSILESYGVDLVLTGHSHSYERSYLLDGHYGKSNTLTPSMIVDAGDGREDGDGAYEKPPGFAPYAGTVYVVVGSSGDTTGGLLNHPAMYLSLNELGSLIVDIDGYRLDAKFLGSTGVVQDYFTIKKNTDGGGTGLVTVSFQDGMSPTSAYTRTQDTYMSETRPDTHYGTSGTLWADGDEGNGKDRAVLLKWENLNIPAGSTVKSATLTLNVTNSSGGTYELYELKRSWSETEATWSQYAAGQSWQVPGAKGTSDRGTTVLGTVVVSSTGKRTVDLNAAGVALIQSWVDSPSKNQGFMLYDSSEADGLAFDSREASTASNRPKLTVTYEPQ